jgi:hypothetical protein
MPDNLKYTFTKYSQPKYYDIGKERLQINREYVGIRVADDQDKIIFYEPDAGKEDFTNQHNLLAEVDSFVEKHLRQIKIDPELLPIEIRKSINYTKLFSRIDKKMEQHIQDIRNHEKLMTDFGHYYNLMQKMSKFTPVGIEAMLTGKKYPRATAIHDFFRGVDRREVEDRIKKLPKEIRELMLEFAKQHNFDTSHKNWITEAEKQFDIAAEKEPHTKKYQEENLYNVVMRAKIGVLIDRLKWKYFKKTNNIEIFFNGTEQAKLNAMSDEYLAQQFGAGATQFFENALAIKQRIEIIIQKKRDITPFMATLNKTRDLNYYNQDIIKLLYTTIKSHYSKFNKNNEVLRFVRALHEVAEDAKLKQEMRDTFGFKKGYEIYVSQEKKLSDVKKERHAKLKQAAERIKSGKVVSEVIIADKMADLYIKYGVKPVDKDKTVQKIHATKTPSRTQKKILERYLSKNK